MENKKTNSKIGKSYPSENFIFESFSSGRTVAIQDNREKNKKAYQERLCDSLNKKGQK